MDVGAVDEKPSPGTSDGGADGEALRTLLYGGEELLETVPVESARVGVTTHRVLAVTPSGDGPRVRSAHRQNVTGAAVRAAGRAAAARRSLKAAVYAVVLIGGGVLVDLEGMIDPVEPPRGSGIGGVVATVNGMIDALALLDDLLLAGGLGALAVTLLFAGRYLQSRDRALEIDVAGDDPIRIPIRGDRTGAAGRIESAVEKASNPSTE